MDCLNYVVAQFRDCGWLLNSIITKTLSSSSSIYQYTQQSVSVQAMASSGSGQSVTSVSVCCVISSQASTYSQPGLAILLSILTLLT